LGCADDADGGSGSGVRTKIRKWQKHPGLACAQCRLLGAERKKEPGWCDGHFCAEERQAMGLAAAQQTKPSGPLRDIK
jgi:hypothetical protein